MRNKKRVWSLWHRSKSLSCRPSQLIQIDDSLAAYCLDGAVVTLGTIIENALLERVEVGAGDSKKSVARYTLKQLLDPKFYLPREGQQGDSPDSPVVSDGEFYDEIK